MSIIIATADGLTVEGITLQTTLDMKVFLDMHMAQDVQVFIAGHQPVQLNTKIDIHSPVGFNCYFTTFKWIEDQKDLQIWFNIIIQGTYTLSVYLYPTRNLDFNVYLGGHSPPSFRVFLHGWVQAIFNALLGAHLPSDLNINVSGQPEPGIGFNVGLRTFLMSSFRISLNATIVQSDLNINLYGLFVNPLDILFNIHGGIGTLLVELPMTTGFSNLCITLYPAHRILSTYISIHTMEMTQFYVLLQQGWPCGFGSSFLNMLLIFKAIPSGFLTVYLKAISGSGLLDLKAYLNTFGFPFYVDRGIPVTISINNPPPPGDTLVFRDIGLECDTVFDEVYQDKITLKVPWPRIRIGTGLLGLLVSYVGIEIPRQLNLSILLNCYRPLPPVIPPQPGPSSGMPDYFSTDEIPIYQFDPMQMVKVVRVMFAEQAYEYVWIPHLNKAFKKNIWEKWCLLGLGYLPDTYYAGQITYPYIQTLCDVGRFKTIDEAVRYLIDTMYWRGSFEMSVLLSITGSISSFAVDLYAWGKDRMLMMDINLYAIQLSDFIVEMNIL